MSEKTVDMVHDAPVNEGYAALDVTKVVNACFLSTILGGSSMPEEVFEAAAQANDEFAWIWEMEEQAGEAIAEITGAEAAHVTTGTYGGMVVSAAACMAGTDRQKMAKLPSDTDGMTDEFIIQRCLRHPKYDRAIETAGGTYVPVGDDSGCTPEEIKEAITEDTAAVQYIAPGPGSWPGPSYVKGRMDGYEGATNAVPLEDVIEIAHRNDVPVIVDAAGQTYPVEGLERYVEMGADLVCYSGKYVTGPNAAGFVIGSEDLVEAVFHNNFIGDEGYGHKEPEKVEYLPDDQYTVRNNPRDPLGDNRTYGIGRGYKLDRSDIVATVEALKYWVELDHEKERFDPALERGRFVMDELSDYDGIETELHDHYYHNVPLEVTFTNESSEYIDELKQGLLEADPMVYPRAIVVTDDGEPRLNLNMLWLKPGEEEIVAERLTEIIS